MATGIEIDTRNQAYLSVEPSSLPGAVTPITDTVTAVCANSQLPEMVQAVVSTPQNSPNLAVVTGYEDQLGNPNVWATEAWATCAA
jgi:hypothetical protein